MYKVLAVLVIYVLSVQNIFAKIHNNYGFTLTSPNIQDKPINQPLTIIPVEPQINVAPNTTKTKQDTKVKKSSHKSKSNKKSGLLLEVPFSMILSQIHLYCGKLSNINFLTSFSLVL